MSSQHPAPSSESPSVQSVFSNSSHAAAVRRKQVSIYTDGACKGNPGPGGWGAVLLYGKFRKDISGGFSRTTNNRMEIMAAVAALDCLTESCEVTLYSDSRYLVDALEKGWLRRWKSRNWIKMDKSPVLNVDLWERLLRLLERHSVRFVWVKGHAENEYNTLCDRMATEEASGTSLPEDPGFP